MEMPAHNPYSPLFRTPVGALPAGQRVTLRIHVPRSYETMDAVLLLRDEQERGDLTLPCTRTAAHTDGDGILYDVFEAGADTRRPGLLWYVFRLQSRDGLPYYYGPMQPTPAHPDVTGGIYNEMPAPWQITVYDPAYDTPTWFAQGVTYQIFPDRFRRADSSPAPSTRDGCTLHTDWTDTPIYKPDAGGKIRNLDFFGGDLSGITQSLDSLHALGVRTLYLNPIFEARENHRYDTGDYERIDPLLGTEADFRTLCDAAHARGMRVVLDGVFSHTGSDSVYFNAQGRYPSVGAAQSRDSRYYPWYHFTQWPDTYGCWWGVPTLPTVNKDNADFRRFILGPDGVVRRWLRAGADGWRLDVADELPESFIGELRKAARAEKPDALVLGEVWEDASHKESYGVRRGHVWGNALDGVMNYPLRTAILDFLAGTDALYFMDSMRALLSHYPRPAQRCLLNLVGSHDTPRILTLLGCPEIREAPGSCVLHTSRDARAAHRLQPGEKRTAIALLRIASAIQYCFPGSPCLYYGDEAGTEGFEDPFNRRTYPWGHEDTVLLAWYRALGQLRAAETALADGDTVFEYAQGSILAFSRRTQTERVLLAVNRSDDHARLPLSWPYASAHDLLSHALLPADGGILNLHLPPMGILLLRGGQS